MMGGKMYSIDIPTVLWEKIKKSGQLQKGSYQEIPSETWPENTKVVFKDLATCAEVFEVIKKMN